MDRDTKRTIIVPLDHGLTVGPLPGIQDLGKTVDMVAMGGANAVLGHIGLLIHRPVVMEKISDLFFTFGSTALSVQKDNKVLVNTVMEG